MTGAAWFGLVAVGLLTACDDGSLQAFEPKRLTLGGAGGRGPDAEAGGGRGGAAGTSPGSAGAAIATSPLVIDDFEDGDTRARLPLGWWYPVNDRTAAQGFGIEPTSPSTTSLYALRTHGSGFGDWGSAVGVDLTVDAAPLDLQSYDELCFRGLIEAGSSNLIQVHLLRGAVHYAREVSLSETWTRYCLPLAEFMNPTQDPFVANEIVALQFFFARTEPFLFWLDDVEVVRN